MNKNDLRPVIVHKWKEKVKGYFHRYIYSSCNYQTETRALIELEDGRLRYFDPYFVQFTDRKPERKSS